jgi:hypothetical protein
MMSAAVAGPTIRPTPSYTTLRDVTPPHGNVRGRGVWTDRVLRLAHESTTRTCCFARARQAYVVRATRPSSTHRRQHGGLRASTARRLRPRGGHGPLCGPVDAPVSRYLRPARAPRARRWMAMAPAQALGLFEDWLRNWPRAEVRHGGIEQAPLALACALAGELDRAERRERRALATCKQTRSATAAHGSWPDSTAP